jgi:hypothetical protein
LIWTKLRGDEGEEGQNGTTGFHFRKTLKRRDSSGEEEGVRVGAGNNSRNEPGIKIIV